MKTNPIRPYARTLDATSPEPLQLPSHVDGQLHLGPATFFLLGAICGAMALGLFAALIIALFF